MTGRPTIFTPELALEICSKLAEGISLREICRAEDMPNASTVHAWVLNDVNGFSKQYETARSIQAENLFDEILDIADDGTNDWTTRQNYDGSTSEALNAEHVQRSRLRIDARKWYLSKVLPKKYGDKVSAEVTGADGAPLIPAAIQIIAVKPRTDDSGGTA